VKISFKGGGWWQARDFGRRNKFETRGKNVKTHWVARGGRTRRKNGESLIDFIVRVSGLESSLVDKSAHLLPNKMPVSKRTLVVRGVSYKATNKEPFASVRKESSAWEEKGHTFFIVGVRKERLQFEDFLCVPDKEFVSKNGPEACRLLFGKGRTKKKLATGAIKRRTGNW